MDFVLKHYQEGKFDTQKAIERFNKTHGIVLRPRRRVFPWVSGIVAAAAAVVLCVFLFRGNDRQIQLMASAGVQEFVLPDGSEVTLAPGSRLTYSEKSPRKTQLEGKAFFEVARDEAVPFEISADGAFVKVLGTKFMVDAGSSVKEVYVTEGKVLFAKSSDAEGVILTKDMLATLSQSDAVPVIAIEPDVNSIAWQRGSFIFDKTPLREVLVEDERSALPCNGIDVAFHSYDRDICLWRKSRLHVLCQDHTFSIRLPREKNFSLSHIDFLD